MEISLFYHLLPEKMRESIIKSYTFSKFTHKHLQTIHDTIHPITVYQLL
jgi:hypothetical protein